MKRDGFSLVELLVYIGIFVAASAFLVGILVVFTQINLRQTSINEVNDQVSFVKNTLQRSVRDSSYIDMTTGSATTTLTLQMASSTLSPTKIYLEDNTVYLKEGGFSAIPLTDSNVTVDDFSVTKYENPGSLALIQVSMTISYNTTNDRAKFKRSIQTAVSRISAATFDSDIIPNSSGSYDIGNASQNWKDAYLSGNLGIGTAPVSAAALKSTGDIAITTSTKGVVFTAPSGSCYRVVINSSLQLATSSVSCP